ncbi:PQQ-binding-like beta-propeller repeat protein [uncultured Winogradskyella sp.]|uniref:outer membrane protein assembly factor BamB family protein n=1 Tax=uncultured Winogradskyella sp. TaxID=395353 RepID=UPI002622A153|nr:PQQ-binding-like beta-propeller repeat protein [uncultured Winogradskyella sp.]
MSIDGKTGNLLWKFENFKGGDCITILDKATVLIQTTGTYKGYLYLLDINTGKLIWKLYGTQMYNYRTKPVVYKNRIYASHKNQVWAVNMDSGKKEMIIKTKYEKVSNYITGTYCDLLIQDDVIYTQLQSKSKKFFLEQYDVSTGNSIEAPIEIAFASDNSYVKGGIFKDSHYYSISTCESHAIGPRLNYGPDKNDKNQYTGKTIFCDLDLKAKKLSYQEIDIVNGVIKNSFGNYVVSSAHSSGMIELNGIIYFSLIVQSAGKENNSKLFTYHLKTQNISVIKDEFYDKLLPIKENIVGVQRRKDGLKISVIDANGNIQSEDLYKVRFYEITDVKLNDDTLYIFGKNEKKEYELVTCKI